MAKPDIYKVLGETIRVRRKQLHFSQEELAERAEFHPNYIGEVERGEKKVTLEGIARIAQALGVSISELVREIR